MGIIGESHLRSTVVRGFQQQSWGKAGSGGSMNGTFRNHGIWEDPQIMGFGKVPKASWVSLDKFF